MLRDVHTHRLKLEEPLAKSGGVSESSANATPGRVVVAKQYASSRQNQVDDLWRCLQFTNLKKGFWSDLINSPAHGLQAAVRIPCHSLARPGPVGRISRHGAILLPRHSRARRDAVREPSCGATLIPAPLLGRTAAFLSSLVRQAGCRPVAVLVAWVDRDLRRLRSGHSGLGLRLGGPVLPGRRAGPAPDLAVARRLAIVPRLPVLLRLGRRRSHCVVRISKRRRVSSQHRLRSRPLPR
mmetsp:Transcript_43582/g.98033  ORF Transcript_43582/g.98033 Transcript_43582/m.98033 type:complete len:239 (+) Transcript_43582:738-1454(+)